jgi:hypothetical protein
VNDPGAGWTDDDSFGKDYLNFGFDESSINYGFEDVSPTRGVGSHFKIAMPRFFEPLDRYV